jgi:hypothetical protein
MNPPFVFPNFTFAHTLASDIEDLCAELDLPLSIEPYNPTPFSDHWSTAIRYHFLQLHDKLSPIPELLEHSYIIGQLLYEEDLRQFRNLTPTTTRVNRARRQTSRKFLQAIEPRTNKSKHHFAAARRVYALFQIRGVQAMPNAEFITPNRLRHLNKDQYQDILRHALQLGQAPDQHVLTSVGVDTL